MPVVVAPCVGHAGILRVGGRVAKGGAPSAALIQYDARPPPLRRVAESILRLTACRVYGV